MCCKQASSAIEASPLAGTLVRYSVLNAPGGGHAVRIDRSQHVRGKSPDAMVGKPIITLNERGYEQVHVDGELVVGLPADVVFIDLARGCCLVSQARRIIREALELGNNASPRKIA